MKSILELRKAFDFNVQEANSSVKYFKNRDIDFNVFLPTKGINLQRDLVWTLEQKRELINSILIGRHIPPMAFINVIKNGSDERWLVIDGKQRLTTMFDFTDNKFTIEIEGNEYCFDELPSEYKMSINYYYFINYFWNEEYGKPITDQEKINWFKFINFAGTPQDSEHIKKLEE